MKPERKGLIDYLYRFITPERRDLFHTMMEQRTRYITVVLEDVYQSHNASAVLRTCECFGIQDVHIIENKNTYTINPDVALGASKWININRYNAHDNNSLETINLLRKKGYRIIATSPHKKGTNLEDFDSMKGRFALFFGTELEGLSHIVLENSDEYINIPILGCTESFNISVSVGIILHHLSLQVRNSTVNWKLNDEEKQEVLLSWLRQSIKKVKWIEDEYNRKEK